jgi:3-oxoacyl-[acyl-carrier protein] reductase
MQSLADQVAIVTGAARGVGRGIASVLAAEGAHVVVADVDAAAAQETAGMLGAHELSLSALELDVTARGSVDAGIARVLGEHGRIDILVANAGVYPVATVAEMDDDFWQRVLDINVTGAMRTVRACLPGMVERRYGRVVLTSSITGPITGQPWFSHYGASKAAMLGFVRSAALEVVRDGITVNAVMPGNVATPGFAETSQEHQRRMLAAIPIGRLAEPEDVGWAVRFLAAPEAGYVTGQTLVVDGGQVLPESPLEDG